MFLAFYVIIYGYWILSGTGIIDGQGKPIGSDFLGYWTASKIILSGNPTDVYDHVKLFSMEESISGIRYLVPVNYPPIYFLIIAPLALLPYLLSLAIWLCSTLLLFLYVIWRIAPHPATIWLTLAFPGTFQNFIHGQNGFLSAAILGGGLLCMERFPFIGGVILGFLTYKPHLAILIPIVLVAGRYWKTLAGMIISTLSLIFVSSLIFGLGCLASLHQEHHLCLQNPGDIRSASLPNAHSVCCRLANRGKSIDCQNRSWGRCSDFTGCCDMDLVEEKSLIPSRLLIGPWHFAFYASCEHS